MCNQHNAENEVWFCSTHFPIFYGVISQFLHAPNTFAALEKEMALVLLMLSFMYSEFHQRQIEFISNCSKKLPCEEIIFTKNFDIVRIVETTTKSDHITQAIN